MLNAYFGGRAPTASWVVGKDGYPTGYEIPPGDSYDPNWNINQPLYENVNDFLNWLDETAGKNWIQGAKNH